MNTKVANNFHKTKAGFLIFGLVELAIAYGFISLAINSGAWWEYVLTLLFCFGSAQNLIKLIGKLFTRHGH